MPKLSIIVPVYKVEVYLEKCIDSILAQSFSDFELILIDDGSPDRCGIICEEYAQKDERVRVIHKENGGLSDARNVGIEIATGEYLAFVDSDDYIAPNMYERLVETIEKSKSDAVICDNYRVDGTEVTVQNWLGNSRIFSHTEIMYEILSDNLGSQAWNKLYKRDLYEDIKFPVGRLFEDIPTTFKYFYKCKKSEYISEPLYYYLIRDTGISLSVSLKRCYHIFLGFKERYEFVKIYCPNFKDICLEQVVNHSIGTSFLSLKDSDKMIFEKIKSFLKANIFNIIFSKKTTTPRKLQVLMLVISGKIYFVLQQTINWVRERIAR